MNEHNRKKTARLGNGAQSSIPQTGFSTGWKLAFVCYSLAGSMILWCGCKAGSNTGGDPPSEKRSNEGVIIPLDYTGDSLLPTIPVEVGSQTLRMILDTASTTVVFYERVPETGYKTLGQSGTISFLMYETTVPTQKVILKTKISGENYTFVGAHMVSVESLSSHLKSDLSGVAGIIGLEFLLGKRFCISRDSIHLLLSSVDVPDTAIPLLPSPEGHIQFKSTVRQNGKIYPVRIMFDTGAGLTQPLVLHPRIASRLALNEAFVLDLGGDSLLIVEYGIQKKPVYNSDIILGSFILNKYKVCVDFNAEKIWFEKNKK